MCVAHKTAEARKSEGDGVEMAIGAHPAVMIFVVQSPSRYVCLHLRARSCVACTPGCACCTPRSRDMGMYTHL